MSGSAAADAGGLGTIEMEAMTSNGYDDDFSAAITAASSVIGPIFPPSIPLIIYGSVASVSVSELFIGGVIPGLLMSVALMVMVFFFAIKRNYPRFRFSLKELGKQFIASILSIITPLIILSGFTAGWFTPTEASSVAVAYALLIAIAVYHTMDWKTFKKCLLESALTSANTLFIIGTSLLFSYVMVKEGISTDIANFILGISDNPNAIMLVINLILLVLGMFMEPGAILTLMIPVLLPIVRSLGIDLVQFGVVMVLNLMIGQVTPPFGVCLFIISDVAKISLNRMYKSILPFIGPLLVVLFMCTFIPGLVTWLPGKLLGA
jgi:tripartite ATP-independent transporter DctM subunit